MDIEIADALDTLTADVRRVESSLSGEIQRVETSLSGEIHRVETSLSREIHRVETSLSARIEGLETSLTATMHELNDDTKRHAEIRFESVHDAIRMVAEAVVALGSKVDSLRR